MHKSNNVSCIIILNIRFPLNILKVRIKIKFSQFQQIQTKSWGQWIWKGLICLVRTLDYSLRKENLHSKDILLTNVRLKKNMNTDT